jgi:predicted DNA-binding transcriptional regulator AlpA
MSDKPLAPDILADRLVSISEVATWAGTTPKSVRFLVATGKLPRPDCRIGRRPKWRSSTIQRWLNEQSKRPTGAAN